MSVKFCPGCGKEISGTPSFCVSCGLNLKPHYVNGAGTADGKTQSVNSPQVAANNPTIIIQQTLQRQTPKIAVVALIISIINDFLIWVLPVLPVLIFVATLIMTIIA